MASGCRRCRPGFWSPCADRVARGQEVRRRGLELRLEPRDVAGHRVLEAVAVPSARPRLPRASAAAAPPRRETGGPGLRAPAACPLRCTEGIPWAADRAVVQVSAQTAAARPVPDVPDDPLDAAVELLLRARVWLGGVVVDDAQAVSQDEQPVLEGVVRRRPATRESLPVEVAEVSLAERGQRRLERSGPSVQPDAHVGIDAPSRPAPRTPPRAAGPSPPAGRNQEGAATRRRPPARPPDGRQPEPVERRRKIHFYRLRADGPALEEKRLVPVAIDPSRVSVNPPPRRRRQVLDGRPQMILRAVAGRDDRPDAPFAGDPSEPAELGALTRARCSDSPEASRPETRNSRRISAPSSNITSSSTRASKFARHSTTSLPFRSVRR